MVSRSNERGKACFYIVAVTFTLILLFVCSYKKVYKDPTEISMKLPRFLEEWVGMCICRRNGAPEKRENGARLSVRKVFGCQKKKQDDLCEDRSSEDFFSVNNLVTIFLRVPAHPLHWNVLQEIEGADGHAETRAGLVMILTERDGVLA